MPMVEVAELVEVVAESCPEDAGRRRPGEHVIACILFEDSVPAGGHHDPVGIGHDGTDPEAPGSERPPREVERRVHRRLEVDSHGTDRQSSAASRV
ncbi:MAG: hypothetical protein EA389_08230 [Ilumatobacter sp.]|nr:MAG: hypothetical protein EA389_08230 [Ilumatobacter sp.]